jgi:hypothetical protein
MSSSTSRYREWWRRQANGKRSLVAVRSPGKLQGMRQVRIAGGEFGVRSEFADPLRGVSGNRGGQFALSRMGGLNSRRSQKLRRPPEEPLNGLYQNRRHAPSESEPRDVISEDNRGTQRPDYEGVRQRPGWPCRGRWSGGATFVMVMQAADVGDLDDRAAGCWLHRAQDGCVLVRASKGPLIPHEDVIETLPSARCQSGAPRTDFARGAVRISSVTKLCNRRPKWGSFGQREIYITIIRRRDDEGAT